MDMVSVRVVVALLLECGLCECGDRARDEGHAQ